MVGGWVFFSLVRLFLFHLLYGYESDARVRRAITGRRVSSECVLLSSRAFQRRVQRKARVEWLKFAFK